MIWSFLRRSFLRVLILPIIIFEVLFCRPVRFIVRHSSSGVPVNTMSLCNICGPSPDQKFRNVLLLSVSFMLLFTAFQTLTNIEQTVLSTVQSHDPSFTGNGFISQAIIYFFFSICNWLAPSFVARLGPKRTMIVGGVIYTAFIASFLWPNTYLLYSMSAILGVGAAIIWTAQGNYLTLSSSPETMSRNAGVFWAVLQCSMFFGNSFVFWQFSGKDIDLDTRTLVFSVLTALSVSGIVCLLFLRPITPDGDLNPDAHNNQEGPYDALKRSFRLFMNKKMILLFFTFFYTGIELSFYSGVHSTAVGNTAELPQPKRLVGLCGILVGAGEVFGGAAFGLLGSRTVKYGRDPIVFLGFLSHITAFYLIFINVPNSSPFDLTYTISYLNPPWVGLVIVSAFLLGLGDACFNTQLFSILGGLFPGESSNAFALFKFTQSAAAAISFSYSSQLNLTIQLSILVVSCLIGTITFFLVEWSETSKHMYSIQSILTSADIREDEQLFAEDENQEYD